MKEKKSFERDEYVSGDWLPGQSLLGDYLVEQMLGEGGMGKVYLVKSKSTPMRFAVKRAKGLNEGDRHNFLAELQTWIDLPEHPNLVPCRFFRTDGDELLIFADYMEGGSLKDWIDSGKLYKGDPITSLERILDMAIQFAWGLHSVHELGIVHQDVKPGNVLIEPSTGSTQLSKAGAGHTGKGNVMVQGLKAKVADFGLARARAVVGDRFNTKSAERSILVSSGGFTPAYCSPEQTKGLPVTRKTDIWSWGVSVMEMFQGEVSWRSGSLAAEALEAFLKHNGEEGNIPTMPIIVADLLRGCFRKDPAQRWASMEVVVQKLRVIYHSIVGAEYSHALVKIEHRTAPLVGVGERRSRDGISWEDPREWLEKALRAEGRDPSEAMEIVARQGSSRRGQLVADIAGYDEAQCIYERLVKGGRKDLENDLARLYQNTAFVHETVDDTSGAVALYDRAIEICERLVNGEGRRELLGDLAWANGIRGVCFIRLGDAERGKREAYEAITVLRTEVNRTGRADLKRVLDWITRMIGENS